MAAMNSGRATSTSIQRSPGCTCPSRRRTRCTPTGWRTAASIRRSPSAQRRWRSPATFGRARRQARCMCIQTAGSCMGLNRAEQTDEFQGKKVFKGGENSIVVYAIDQSTGEPKPIQHADTQKIHPRTFHIDPSGRLLVAQHNLPVDVREGDTVKTVPAGLSVFRIGDDGKLTFVRAYDVDVGDKTMFWMGMVPL